MSDQEKMREEFEQKWIRDMGEHCPLTIANVAVFFSNADAAHKEEIEKERAICTEYIEQRNEALNQLAAAQHCIEQMREALKDLLFAYENYSDIHAEAVAQASDAISASSESVAAWERDKLHSLRRRIIELEEKIKK